MSTGYRYLYRKISLRDVLYYLYVKLIAATVLRRTIKMIKSSGLFDEETYVKSNPEMDLGGVDPIIHYLLFGRFYGKIPGKDFLKAFFVNTGSHKIQAKFSLFQWIFHKRDQFRIISQKELIDTVRQDQPPIINEIKVEIEISDLYKAYQLPETDPCYEKEDSQEIPETTLKLIAYYLPQYHPFKENDEFWGRGFTEWTNVTKARPFFKEHIQPRLPGELGFYDTRIKDVMKRQIELAKQHGIYGFCFHHYFFQGKPVMRVPLNQILSNKEMDFPFCLHWANESWSTRFDGYGREGGMLIEQKHSAEDDLAFFRDIEYALNDKRYIRIDGKPLLLVYRPGLFPDIESTTNRWRECAARSGIGDLFLVMIQTGFDEFLDPTEYGFDAAAEFPPHRSRNISIRDRVKLYDPDFKGYVCSYQDVMKGSIEREKPEYRLFKGIFPNWDNTPRIRNSVIYHGSEPVLYQEWLESIGRYTKQNFPSSQQLIFINAWNEWAEGAYLEPDRHYGYAYLNATSRALRKISTNQP
jgi:hypothetical protein